MAFLKVNLHKLESLQQWSMKTPDWKNEMQKGGLSFPILKLRGNGQLIWKHIFLLTHSIRREIARLIKGEVVAFYLIKCWRSFLHTAVKRKLIQNFLICFTLSRAHTLTLIVSKFFYLPELNDTNLRWIKYIPVFEFRRLFLSEKKFPFRSPRPGAKQSWMAEWK